MITRSGVETSCARGTGIEKLRAAICREVDALEHVHDQLVSTWFEVKAQLEGEKEKQDYIPYQAYIAMCKEKGVADERSQRTLLDFLHDLGVVLNYADDPRLVSTYILNPEWVTNGVYLILNDNDLMAGRSGILDRELLAQLLTGPRYPPDKQFFIVDMMRKFELCIDVPGFPDQRWLIPDLLPRDEPDTGGWDDALAFQFKYNVLPGSIITRFITRMHADAHQDTYWRTGIVLDYEGNRARVRADLQDALVDIRVNGPPSGRSRLLAVIRAQFRDIHRTISGIQAEERVPLPGHPEIVVSYQHLLNLEKLGETTFIPAGLLERVNVRQLLTGVDPGVGPIHLRLREILTRSFSEDGLAILCYDLGIDHDSLPGSSHARKALALAAHLERRRLFPVLQAYCKQNRPDIKWD